MFIVFLKLYLSIIGWFKNHKIVGLKFSTYIKNCTLILILIFFLKLIVKNNCIFLIYQSFSGKTAHFHLICY